MICCNLSRCNNFIFLPFISTSPSFFKSESSRISVSVAVPTKLLKSSRETLSFNVPSSSTPKSEAISSRISANRAFTDFWAMSRYLGQYHFSSAGDGDTVLFLFVNPTFYWLHQRGAAPGRDLLFPDLLPYGRPGKSSSAYEHFRGQGRHHLRGRGVGHCSGRRYAD